MMLTKALFLEITDRVAAMPREVDYPARWSCGIHGGVSLDLGRSHISAYHSKTCSRPVTAWYRDWPTIPYPA